MKNFLIIITCGLFLFSMSGCELKGTKDSKNKNGQHDPTDPTDPDNPDNPATASLPSKAGLKSGISALYIEQKSSVSAKAISKGEGPGNPGGMPDQSTGVLMQVLANGTAEEVSFLASDGVTKVKINVYEITSLSDRYIAASIGMLSSSGTDNTGEHNPGGVPEKPKSKGEAGAAAGFFQKYTIVIDKDTQKVYNFTDYNIISSSMMPGIEASPAIIRGNYLYATGSGGINPGSDPAKSGVIYKIDMTTMKGEPLNNPAIYSATGFTYLKDGNLIMKVTERSFPALYLAYGDTSKLPAYLAKGDGSPTNCPLDELMNGIGGGNGRDPLAPFYGNDGNLYDIDFNYGSDAIPTHTIDYLSFSVSDAGLVTTRTSIKEGENLYKFSVANIDPYTNFPENIYRINKSKGEISLILEDGYITKTSTDPAPVIYSFVRNTNCAKFFETANKPLSMEGEPDPFNPRTIFWSGTTRFWIMEGSGSNEYKICKFTYDAPSADIEVLTTFTAGNIANAKIKTCWFMKDGLFFTAPKTATTFATYKVALSSGAQAVEYQSYSMSVTNIVEFTLP